MPKVHGVSISFGIGTTIYGVNGMFQSREHHYIANSEPIMDGGDTTVSKVYWDFREEASFVYVAYQPAHNFYDAFVQTPQIGSFVTVADFIYPAVSTDGGYNYAIDAYRGPWLVDDVAISNSNTTAVRVSVKLSRYPHLQNV
jgi:hypothetical protein